MELAIVIVLDVIELIIKKVVYDICHMENADSYLVLNVLAIVI